MKPTLNKMAKAALLTCTLLLPVTATAETNNSVAASRAAAFEQTLRRYLRNASFDNELQMVLRKHKVTLQYTLPDTGLVFHMGFSGGTFTATTGGCATTPEVAFSSDVTALEQFLNGCEGELNISMELNMNILRKLSLRKDWGVIRTALTRIYAATVKAGASEPSLLATVQ